MSTPEPSPREDDSGGDPATAMFTPVGSPVSATPTQDGTTIATPPPPELKTPAFPPQYRSGMTPGPKLQQALNDSIVNGPGIGWPVGLCIVAFESDGSRPAAHFGGDRMHYGASLLKYAAMYSAFELRKTVNEVGAELGSAVSKATFLKTVAAYLNPLILAKTKSISGLKGIADAHALPKYSAMFDVVSAGSGFGVQFSTKFATELTGMMVNSYNDSAAKCVQGSGYGYMNGALESAGFFNASTNTGVWLAGDYKDQKSGKYPAYRVPSVNDGPSAQASTAIALIRMYLLMFDKRLVDKPSSEAMLRELAEGVAGYHLWIHDETAQTFKLTHTKIGLGQVNKRDNSIKDGLGVWSEGSIVRHNTTGRDFGVVWLNYNAQPTGGFESVAQVIRETIERY